MKIVIAIPAYNEALILKRSIKKLFQFCADHLNEIESVIIVIANNNSTDETEVIANILAEKYDAVEHIFIPQKGKGLAVATVWQKYEADLYVFMDADLATDLSAWPEALAQIEAGAEVVVGSRFHKKSLVQRSWQRRLISQGYRWFFKTFFWLKINDFPCGFKMVTRPVRNQVVPEILNRGFFWDTELLVLAHKHGFKIVEIPVIWSEFAIDGRKSQVNLIPTSLNYIKESIKLRWRLWK